MLVGQYESKKLEFSDWADSAPLAWRFLEPVFDGTVQLVPRGVSKENMHQPKEEFAHLQDPTGQCSQQGRQVLREARTCRSLA